MKKGQERDQFYCEISSLHPFFLFFILKEICCCSSLLFVSRSLTWPFLSRPLKAFPMCWLRLEAGYITIVLAGLHLEPFFCPAKPNFGFCIIILHRAPLLLLVFSSCLCALGNRFLVSFKEVQFISEAFLMFLTGFCRMWFPLVPLLKTLRFYLLSVFYRLLLA